LPVIREQEKKIIGELQTGARTHSIKNLQAISLQRVITAVGMFSVFEAVIQNNVDEEYSFRDVKTALNGAGKGDLSERFNDYIDAINVLKHGKGRSYDSLVSRADRLGFRIRMPDENFFHEGDVSELSFLIQVDDTFILKCAEIIGLVSAELSKLRPDVWHSIRCLA
jgi:hypothetical protein